MFESGGCQKAKSGYPDIGASVQSLFPAHKENKKSSNTVIMKYFTLSIFQSGFTVVFWNRENGAMYVRSLRHRTIIDSFVQILCAAIVPLLPEFAIANAPDIEPAQQATPGIESWQSQDLVCGVAKWNNAL
ncbi:MAG: hypothetical protein AAF557_28395 [Pseudomonadota bacterium]